VATPGLATFDLDLNSGAETQVALYFSSDTSAYNTDVTVFDALGRQLSEQTVSHFHNGKWLLWRIAGHVRFVVHPVNPPAGDPNTNQIGLQGIMLDLKSANTKRASPPRPLH